MIRRSIIILLSVAAIALLTLGIVSYKHAVPSEQLWIDKNVESPSVRCAIVRGIVHVVYIGPLKTPPTGLVEQSFGGFYVKHNTIGQTYAQGFGLPFWAVVPLLIVYPFEAFRRGPWLRRKRRKRGECIHCGYNLTGMSHDRCPECGDTPPTTTQQPPPA